MAGNRKPRRYTAPLAFYLTPEMKERLVQVAGKQDLAFSELVRMVLGRYLEEVDEKCRQGA